MEVRVLGVGYLWGLLAPYSRKGCTEKDLKSMISIIRRLSAAVLREREIK